MLIFLTCNAIEKTLRIIKVIDQVLGNTQNILPKTKISPGIILGTSDKRI